MKKKIVGGILLLSVLGIHFYQSIKLRKTQKDLKLKQDIVLKNEEAMSDVILSLNKQYSDLERAFMANAYITDEHLALLDEQFATIYELLQLHTESMETLIDENREEITTLYTHLEELAKTNESEV